MNDTYRFPHLEERQTISRLPTEWEGSLADAIEAAFAKGHWALEDLVTALNRSRVRPKAGGAWTAETFTATMQELGA